MRDNKQRRDEKHAVYSYYDLGSTRLHHWMPSGKWAVGNGPIDYIDERRAAELLSAHSRANCGRVKNPQPHGESDE